MRHLRAILALPVMVTVVSPGILTWVTGSVNVGWGPGAPGSWLPAMLGLLSIGLGLALLVNTICLFVHVGRGTLAP